MNLSIVNCHMPQTLWLKKNEKDDKLHGSNRATVGFIVGLIVGLVD